MAKGSVIFLNGSSSSGKTTLALALQEVLTEPFIHVALDQFRDGMPAAYRGLNSPPGTCGHAGLNVVPIHRDGVSFTDIQFGPMGLTMLKGMRRAIAALATAANNVIIDDIIMQPDFLSDYVQVLQPFDVLFVAVRCPLAEINRREAARPGRFPGTALGHFDVVHAHGTYDVEVDTSRQTPADCAADVVQRWRDPNHPLAFKRLAALTDLQK
jgi:chloramphenicol 3-O phosphotransferase